jgi:hypothetical protein
MSGGLIQIKVAGIEELGRIDRSRPSRGAIACRQLDLNQARRINGR